jgi:uncharacterized membrane protein YkvA (DUF1232 family)
VARTEAQEAQDDGKRRKRRSGGGGMRRLMGLMAFLPIASRAPAYTRLIWALITDSRTPPARKAMLAGALGYLVVGRDIVPDDLPLIGGLDDLVVVVLAVDLFLDGIPASLLEEKIVELGIDRQEFDEDLARVRKLTPGPVRRAVRRIPGMVATVGDAVDRSGLAPTVRKWISKEGSIA